MDLIWSRYTHTIKVKTTNYLFHSLTFCIIRIDCELNPAPHMTLSPFEKEHISLELTELLKSHNMLIENPAEDNRFLNNLLSKNKTFDIRNIILLISNDCNMDCSYCQIEQNIFNAKKRMQLDKSLSALRLFEDVCSREQSLTINFTGGEPLLNFDVICETVKYIRNSEILNKSRLVIFTNGTLITEEIAKFFKANNFLVIVSLDGDESQHNLNRKFLNGSDSYAKVLQGYFLIREIGCNCAISSVANLSTNNFDAYLDWLIDLNPLSVGINYPHLLLNDGEKNHTFSAYTSQTLKAQKILSENGITLENYARFSRTFQRNEIRRRECQACGRGITIDSNGNIGTCKSLLVSGKISYPLSNFELMNAKEFEIWANRTPLNNDKCLDCPAISICGGGCAYDAYCLFDGNACEMDRRLCPHIKSIFQDLLENRIRDTESVSSHFLFYEPTKNVAENNIYDSVGH